MKKIDPELITSLYFFHPFEIMLNDQTSTYWIHWRYFGEMERGRELNCWDLNTLMKYHILFDESRTVAITLMNQFWLKLFLDQKSSNQTELLQYQFVIFQIQNERTNKNTTTQNEMELNNKIMITQIQFRFQSVFFVSIFWFFQCSNWPNTLC